jgi:cysteine-rich repeat protein
MSSTKCDQTKKRWLPGSAVLWLFTATALGACDDGPTYGEIPRFGGAGAGGKATGSAGKGGKGGTGTGIDGHGGPLGQSGNGEGGEDGEGGEQGLAGDGTGATNPGSGGTGNGTAGTGNGTAGTGNGTAGTSNGTAGTSNGTAGTSNGMAGSGSLGGSGGTGGTGAGTSGSGGTGGTKPVNLCGNGKIDAGETCDDGNKLSGDGCSAQCQCACEACEKSEACYSKDNHLTNLGLRFYDAGYMLEGVAMSGPAANVPLKELFADALDCVRRSHCLENVAGPTIPVKCVCANPTPEGADPTEYPPDCYNEATFIEGPCYNQFLDASEGDSLVNIKERMTSQEFALGFVYGIIEQCDMGECRTECFSPEERANFAPSLPEADAFWTCGNCEAENACMPP